MFTFAIPEGKMCMKSQYHQAMNDEMKFQEKQNLQERKREMDTYSYF